jgi:hypothetical protein
VGLTVRLTATTAALLALVWLPALFKVAALAGNGVKTPAGEVGTTGLLAILREADPAAKREALPGVIGALALAAAKEPAAAVYQGILEQELERVVASNVAEARAELAAALAEYQALRALPFGPERTAKMSAVAARIRAFAARCDFTPAELRALLRSNPEGGAVVLSALAQRHPDAGYFDIVLRGVREPAGPQEQYEALLAIEALVPSLTAAQRKAVAEVIRGQAYLTPENRGRWEVSRRILKAIKPRRRA